MPLVVKGTTVKKLNYRGTACKKHIAKGVQVWSAEEYLVKQGVFQDITGGYVQGKSIGTGGNYKDIEFSVFDNENVIRLNSISDHQAIFRTKNKIDLSSVDTIFADIVYYENNGSGGSRLILYIDTNSAEPCWPDNYKNIYKYAVKSDKTTNSGVRNTSLSLDVSNVTGSYYIYFAARCDNGSNSIWSALRHLILK